MLRSLRSHLTLKTVFVSGIIAPHYDSRANGLAIAATEPARKPDLYLDYGLGIEQPVFVAIDRLIDPRPIDLLARARDFAQTTLGGNSKFALLRLWSAPYFFPFTMGYDKRYIVAFNDAHERCWEWKFMPKDMNHTE